MIIKTLKLKFFCIKRLKLLKVLKKCEKNALKSFDLEGPYNLGFRISPFLNGRSRSFGYEFNPKCLKFKMPFEKFINNASNYRIMYLDIIIPKHMGNMNRNKETKFHNLTDPRAWFNLTCLINLKGVYSSNHASHSLIQNINHQPIKDSVNKQIEKCKSPKEWSQFTFLFQTS